MCPLRILVLRLWTPYIDPAMGFFEQMIELADRKAESPLEDMEEEIGVVLCDDCSNMNTGDRSTGREIQQIVPPPAFPVCFHPAFPRAPPILPSYLTMTTL